MKVGVRPSEGGTDFSNALAQAEYAESQGFDSVWFAEHYGPDEEWWPSPLVSLGAVAARTSEITIGTNIVIAPLYNPVWLAAATAMLDVISEGRFVCGLGVGYSEPEYEAMGVDREERVGRFIEGTIALKRLWTEEEASFDGQYYELEEYGVTPKPNQDPRPPIWFGVWGEYLLGQAAKRADAWIPGAVADLDTLLEKQAIYDDGLDGDPQSRPLLRDIVVADSDAAALEAAERHLHPKYETYRGYGHPQFRDYERSNFESFCRARAIVGTPDACIEQVQEYREAFGVDHLLLRFSYPGMPTEDITGTMETIANDVMPSFE